MQTYSLGRLGDTTPSITVAQTQTQAAAYLASLEPTCAPSGAFLKDANGKLIPQALMFPVGLAVAGVVAIAANHTVIGSLLIAFGFINASIFSCSLVPPGNSCAGFTQCNTFLCRNGGCGF
jgi:hypothetical protein